MLNRRGSTKAENYDSEDAESQDEDGYDTAATTSPRTSSINEERRESTMTRWSAPASSHANHADVELIEQRGVPPGGGKGRSLRTDSRLQINSSGQDSPLLAQPIQRLRMGMVAEQAAISRVNAVISLRLIPVPNRIAGRAPEDRDSFRHPKAKASPGG